MKKTGQTPWNKGTKGLFVSGMKGKKQSIESRLKMSKAKLGHEVSDDTRKKISESRKKMFKLKKLKNERVRP